MVRTSRQVCSGAFLVTPWRPRQGLHSHVSGWVQPEVQQLRGVLAQVDDLVLLHGVDEESGAYLEPPWNLARVSSIVPRVPKWS